MPVKIGRHMITDNQYIRLGKIARGNLFDQRFVDIIKNRKLPADHRKILSQFD